MIKKMYSLLAILSVFALTFTACNDDDELTANITINETGSDLGGDVTGDGGSASRSYDWENNLQTVDYNMDITAAQGGSFQLLIQDANGETVLNQVLEVGQGDDSRSGVSNAGVPGTWKVTVTATNFVGDGSFSISPGD